MQRGSMILLGLVGLVFAFTLTAFWPAGAQPNRGAVPAGGAGGGLVAQGKDAAGKYGCVACHTVNGSTSVGTTWKGLAGSERELDSGQKVVADDAYLAESITDPDAKVVKGFPKGVMGPSTQPFKADLSKPETVQALVAYIKSLK